MNQDTTRQEFVSISRDRKEQAVWVRDVFDAACSSTPTTTGPADATMRALNAAEIAALESNGCRSSDFSKLRLLLLRKDGDVGPQNHASSFEQVLQQCVSQTCFEGVVVLCLDPRKSTRNDVTTLNSSSKTATVSAPHELLPRGIHHNGVVSNSILVLDSWVWHNSIVSSTYIAADAVVLRCGSLCAKNNIASTVTRTDNSTQANDAVHEPALEITVGPESGGGRNLRLSSEATMMEVYDQLRQAGGEKKGNEGSFANSVWSWNILNSHAMLRDTAVVESVYMHSRSSIQGAASVKRAILFPQASIGAASTVFNVRLQWKAAVGSQTDLADALLVCLVFAC